LINTKSFFLKQCTSTANTPVVLEDLSVDSIYHLHLLHPTRFRYDCLLEYNAPIHHFPEAKNAILIYRKDTQTGEYQLLDYNPQTSQLQLKDPTWNIPNTQRWKKKYTDRIVPLVKSYSSRGLNVYLSLKASKLLINSNSLNENVFQLAITEAMHPSLALQSWDIYNFKPSICLVEDLANWDFNTKTTTILWKRQKKSERYQWGTMPCPIISI